MKKGGGGSEALKRDQRHDELCLEAAVTFIK